MQFAHRRLTGPDIDWKIACRICTVLPTVQNGGARIIERGDGTQGMAVTYRLLPGLAWADGVPVTSEDIRFSWSVGRIPLIGFGNTDIYYHIEAVDIIDESTFTLRMDRTHYQYNTPYFFEILPEHIEGPILAGLADKSTYLKHSAYITNPTLPGLWDGPYRLIDYRPGEAVRFVRNPYWPGPQPYFRQITVRLYPGSREMVSALLDGEVDTMVPGYLPPEVDHELIAGIGGAYEITAVPSPRYLHIDLNLDRPQFQDRAIRQALLLALDREAVTLTAFNDRRPVANAFLPPQDPGYDPAVRRYPYDPAQAIALLHEEGWERAPGDGVWTRRADGQRLAFGLSGSAATGVFHAIAQAIIEQWRPFGIDVHESIDPILLSQSLPHRNFDAAIFSWNSVPEFAPEPMLSSHAIPTAANGFSGLNFPGFKDARMDQLLVDLTSELDPDRRPALWARLIALYVDELPVLPLFHFSDTVVRPRWLKGLVATDPYSQASSFAELWTRQATE